MRLSIFTLFILIYASIGAKSSYGEGESLENIAKKYAPEIRNEIDPKGNFPQYDHIDFVYYHAAETETHIFLNYHVMKSWSEAPMLQWGIATEHPLDSEDIQLILWKRGQDRDGNARLVPVTFRTNAHGYHLYHFNREVIDSEEFKKFSAETLSKEGNFFFISQALNKTLSKDVTFFEGKSFERPIVFSSARSHALSRGFDEIVDLNPMIQAGTLEISMPPGVQNAKYPSKAYDLRPLIKDLSVMQYSDGLKKVTPDKARPCDPVIVSYRGKNFASPALPTHFDPIWYLSRYNKALYREIVEGKLAKRQKTYLYVPEADIFYSGGKASGDEEWICRNIDQAKYFQNLFPKTFAAQKGSLNYTNYELLRLNSPAFAQNDANRSPGQASQMKPDDIFSLPRAFGALQTTLGIGELYFGGRLIWKALKNPPVMAPETSQNSAARTAPSVELCELSLKTELPPAEVGGLSQKRLAKLHDGTPAGQNIFGRGFRLRAGGSALLLVDSSLRLYVWFEEDAYPTLVPTATLTVGALKKLFS